MAQFNAGQDGAEKATIANRYTDISEETLDSTWKDADLARLALHVVSWEELAPFWGLTEAEEEEIKRNNPKYVSQKLAALRRWKTKSPETATYRQLVRVFKRMGKMELVEKVREILLCPEGHPTYESEGVLSSYREFLEKSYKQLPNPGMLTNQWPIVNNPAYVPLHLSKQPRPHCMQRLPSQYSPFRACVLQILNEYKNIQPENDEKDVHLHQLFSGCSGGKIVIKGFPGSGKSTLTWHANQQWAKRDLFQQFSLFITIPLGSTQVQRATCLADLIPHPDQEQKKAIAQAISTSHGEGVCFWFDGWDEMPQKVQRNSFIASFIRRDSPGSSLPECAIVVTSRPEASFLGSSEEFWMKGFSVDQMNEIITKRVEGTDHDPSKLITSVEKSTSLQAFCFVPLNVAILVSLFFLFKSGLPNTQTELFECLVLNLILRNLQMRWKLDITSLKSFAALPNSASQSFRSICEIAFNGILNAKSAFSRFDVPNHEQQPLPLSTLGLMEINPRIEWYGVEEELTFLHTTLQEFLAAVHLTTLENEKQTVTVKRIVESGSLDQRYVLQFYAGLTRLSSSEMFTSIIQRFRETRNPVTNEFSMGDFEGSGSLPSFMMFINCVVEAQSGQLCLELINRPPLHLTFNNIDFNATDISNLGYFIGWFCRKKACVVTFDNCYSSPRKLRMFVNQVKYVWSNEFQGSSLSLFLTDTLPCVLPGELRYERIHALCGLIKNTNLVSEFHIELCFQIVNDSLKPYHAAMKCLIEALARNSSCTTVTLSYDIELLFSSRFIASMDVAYSEYYAVLLITFCKCVKTIRFRNFFKFDYSYPLFACALKYNNNIHCLHLSANLDMNEEAIANIAQALSFNATISTVFFGEWISAGELATFLNCYASHGLHLYMSGLEMVLVGERATLGEKEHKILKLINTIRGRMFAVMRFVGSHCVCYTGFDTRVRQYRT